MIAEFPRDFLGISISDQPNKYYFIIRGQRIVLEADITIQAIMEKLQSYKSRETQYQLGDFQVRVGKVALSHAETMRGLVM
ncbi:Mediator of RNA polymerase II transcription subunit 20a, partial [Bienertia sinuspersici]